MILPSILSASHLRLKELLEPLHGVAPMLHVDLEDGVFVPNISFGPKLIQEIYDTFGFALDVHYMVREPQRFIDMFADIPQEMISYHAETGVHPRDITVPEGTLLGIAVNPDSPRLSPDILSSIDFVVVMGVHPGFGGAPFEASTYETVSWYDQYRGDRELPFEILVDGGVSRDNIRALIQAGGDHFVVGSGIFKYDPLAAYRELTTLCDDL
ncbi:MAG: ribulose-phosphate 3-epimerase [Candidatus Methanofastidiosa archaeon]|nr:ribulose-phosphate 3-epimerase [Candidatus Methanofastidiosa archaeon]